jgi:hypothetical protein
VLVSACLGAALAAPAFRLAAAAQASENPPTDAAELSAAVAGLERRLELASSEAFYLVLDAEALELRLMFGGALLHRFPVTAVDEGRPRAAFVDLGHDTAWQTAVWRHGTLVPPRNVDEWEIQPPDLAAGEEPELVIPPTAEEAIPVPPRYRVRFADDLALEVRRVAEPGELGWWARLGAGWSVRWADVRSALRRADRDAVRVRVTLEKAPAESLYRSLPPDVSLLVTGLSD